MEKNHKNKIIKSDKIWPTASTLSLVKTKNIYEHEKRQQQYGFFFRRYRLKIDPMAAAQHGTAKFAFVYLRTRKNSETQIIFA